MVQIVGKYQHHHNENLDEYFKACGKYFTPLIIYQSINMKCKFRYTLHPSEDDVRFKSAVGDHEQRAGRMEHQFFDLL